MFEIQYLGWSIEYIEGSLVIISTYCCILSDKVFFVLANSVNHDEMPHFVAFHQGLHCLPHTVKPVLRGHSKDQKLVFKTNYHLMQVKVL